MLTKLLPRAPRFCTTITVDPKGLDARESVLVPCHQVWVAWSKIDLGLLGVKPLAGRDGQELIPCPRLPDSLSTGSLEPMDPDGTANAFYLHFTAANDWEDEHFR